MAGGGVLALWATALLAGSGGFLELVGGSAAIDLLLVAGNGLSGTKEFITFDWRTVRVVDVVFFV